MNILSRSTRIDIIQNYCFKRTETQPLELCSDKTNRIIYSIILIIRVIAKLFNKYTSTPLNRDKYPGTKVSQYTVQTKIFRLLGCPNVTKHFQGGRVKQSVIASSLLYYKMVKKRDIGRGRIKFREFCVT